MMLQTLLLLHLLFLAHSYEKLPGYKSDVDPQLLYDGRNMKFGIGTIKDSNSVPYLQIPTGDGMHLHVPKSFYHYSEQDVEAGSDWKIPNAGSLMSLNSLLRNNRKDISGMYLPLPHMQPINLHFISQRKFEKGIDTSAHDSTSDGALAAAKRLCVIGSESDCERALLRYHRKKALSYQQQRKPLYQQLLDLGDLTSYSVVKDREGRGIGVVIGVPGYEPLYVGAELDSNKDGNIGFQFSPPE